jgi:hypothetical protein
MQEDFHEKRSNRMPELQIKEYQGKGAVVNRIKIK